MLAARIEKFFQENEPKPGKQYKEARSNVTDNESAMMTTHLMGLFRDIMDRPWLIQSTR